MIKKFRRQKVNIREKDVIERKRIYFIPQVLHRIMQRMYRISQYCKIYVAKKQKKTQTNLNNLPEGKELSRICNPEDDVASNYNLYPLFILS